MSNKRQLRGRNLFLLCLLITLLALPFIIENAYALMVKIPLEELTKKANYILIGKVKNMRCAWNPESTLIYTYVTVSVERYIKNILDKKEVPKEVTIRYVGGIVGDIGLWQSDTPTFKGNQQVLLFLQPIEKGIFKVTGRFQGKYTIEKDRILEKGVSVNHFVNQIKRIIESQKK
ncbi:MAG TPA: hypothetical protein EYP60_08520 [bacterium (Candidatus Stahlbacteria)]|nr:hypothetical protein [Candidatus Stahlbacteria bacterium]